MNYHWYQNIHFHILFEIVDNKASLITKLKDVWENMERNKTLIHKHSTSVIIVLQIHLI